MSTQELIAVKIEDVIEQKSQLEQKPVPEPEQFTEEPKRKRARTEVDREDIEEGSEVPIASTSTLNPLPDDRPWPFIVVRYEGRAITIRRKFHYTEVIASIKKVFQSLRTTCDEQIRLVGVFQGLGDSPIEISAEVWPELAADLQTITAVRVGEEAPRRAPPMGAGLLPITPGFTRPPDQPPRGSITRSTKPYGPRH